MTQGAAPHLAQVFHWGLEDFRNWAEQALVTVRDLRREFASRLLESGASKHAVRDWLGHTNLTTTNRYLSNCRVHLLQARTAFEHRRVAASGG